MASIRKITHRTGRMLWQARWRDPPGSQRSKNFGRRIDTERFFSLDEIALDTDRYQPNKRIIRIKRSLAEVRGLALRPNQKRRRPQNRHRLGRLGHTSVTTVLDVYGHLYEDLYHNAANTLNAPWDASMRTRRT